MKTTATETKATKSDADKLAARNDRRADEWERNMKAQRRAYRRRVRAGVAKA